VNRLMQLKYAYMGMLDMLKNPDFDKEGYMTQSEIYDKALYFMDKLDEVLKQLNK
jgi:hypothetical protein